MILIFILGLVALRILYSVGEVCYERDWPRDTWKGLLIALGVLCIAVSAFGQAARVDLPLLTAGPSVPISGGPLPQALWVANAAAYLCTHPSATLVACQAAPITTYTDSTEGTTCPTATPLVQLPGNTCTASTGTAANVGFWYGGGVFDYWIVSSYGTYGPFSGNSSNSALPSSCGNPTGIPCGGTGATTAAGALANLGGLPLSGGTLTGALNGTSATFSSTVAAPTMGPMYIADAFPGADCGAKINAAVVASGGLGTIQVGSGCGSTIAATVNPSGLPVAIQFVSAGTWTLSAPIIVGATGGSISGISSSEVTGPTILEAAANYSATCPADTAGTTYSALICMQSGSSLHDLTIDGNKANQSGNVQDVLMQNASSVKIHNAAIQNASQDGIHVTTTFYPMVTASQALSLNAIFTIYINSGTQLFKVTTAGTGTSSYPGYPSGSCTSAVALNSTCTWGGATLTNIGPSYDSNGLGSGNGWVGPNVLIRWNGRDGMFTERNVDWTLSSAVQFEVNGRDGFHSEDNGAYRFEADDWGANGRYGFYAAVVNGVCATAIPTMGDFIIGSQFGANGLSPSSWSGAGGDIYVNGSAASAIGFCATPITYQWAGANTIIGNQFIGSAASANLTNSIQFIDAGGNDVTGNTWGLALYQALYNYLVTSSFSTLTSSARVPNQISKTSVEPTASGPIYQTATPYSLTTGIDKADAVISQGTETEWGNRVINGTVAAGATTPTTIGSNGVLLNGVPALQSQTSLYNYYSGGAGNLTGTGPYNTANGFQALFSNTTGSSNSANGFQALYSNTTGNYNTVNGYAALFSNTTGSSNTANGQQAGRYIADGVTANQTSSNSVYDGFQAYPLANGDTNENVIGNTAIGHGSNTSTLGNSSIVGTYYFGALYGPSARKSTFTCTAGGTIAVANTNEAATSDVIISLHTVGGTISTAPAMKTVTAGTGFTVLCGSLDTSVYNYDILN